MEVVIPCASYDYASAGSPAITAANNHVYVAFDAAADESIVCSFTMPLTYQSGSNLTGKVRMRAATATANTVRVRLEFERNQIGTTDTSSDSYDAAVEANATAAGTAGIWFEASFTLANGDLDGVAAGEPMRVKITRVGTDGTNDTMTGDAYYAVLILSQ